MNDSYFSFFRRQWLLLGCILTAFMTCLDSQGQGLTLKGEWNIGPGDHAAFVAVQGTNAFVITRGDKLRIADISDSTNPKWLGEVQLTQVGSIYRALGRPVVSGNYVYVSGQHSQGQGRLYVIDITDRSQPTVASSLPLPFGSVPGGRHGLAVFGGRAYVAAGFGGLLIFDVSDPSAPRLIGRYSQGEYVWDVEINDGLAYLALGGMGLRIVDVTDPAAPWRVGDGANSNLDARDLFLRGNHIYIAGDRFGSEFAVIDVTNPVTPTAVVTVRLAGPEAIPGITASASHIFLSCGPKGFYVYDTSALPSAPQVATVNTTISVSDVAIAGAKAYVADSEGGLLIFDIQNEAQPIRLGSLPINFLAAYPHAVSVAGNLAFLRDAYNGIHLFDVAVPSLPRKVSTYYLPDGVGPVVAAANRAYISAFGGFDIVDVSDANNPTKIGQYRAVDGIPDIVLSGHHIITSLGDVVNVSNPASPEKIGAFSTPYVPITAMKIEGNYIYFLYYVDANYQTPKVLGIIDITQPTAPVQRGVVSVAESQTPGVNPLGFAVSGGYVYVARPNSTVIFNANNPDAISFVSARSYPGGPLDAVGSKLYEARGVDGVPTLTLENINVPSLPVVVDSEPLSYIVDLEAEGNLVYVISQQGVGYTPASFKIFEGTLGPEPVRPALSAFLQDRDVILRWSTEFTGLKLYSTVKFGDPWQLVTNTPYQEGSYYTFTNTRPVAASLFYRLSDQ
jgi:hypothetical protein